MLCFAPWLRSSFSLETKFADEFPFSLIWYFGELEWCDLGFEDELGAWGSTVVLSEYLFILRLVLLNDRWILSERFV